MTSLREFVFERRDNVDRNEAFIPGKNMYQVSALTRKRVYPKYQGINSLYEQFQGGPYKYIGGDSHGGIHTYFQNSGDICHGERG